MRPFHLVPRLVISVTAVLTLLAAPALVAAHVELTASSPEAGANLDEPPTEVSVTFDGELDPEGSTFTVTDAGGNEIATGEVDLEVADRNVMRAEVEITEPGVYGVTWTALGDDGHEVTGEFAFGFQADPAAQSARGGSGAPNTAVAAAGGGEGLTALGALFLALAGIVVAGTIGARRSAQ